LKGRASASTLADAFELLHPRVVRAIRAAHEAYERLGIRHALIGALAVGVHGHVRATTDVDYLVGSEAFETTGTLVSFRAGVPVASEGVPVDSILAPEPFARVLDEALAQAIEFDGVPVVRAEHLVFMKMVAGGRQHLADVEALLRSTQLDVARTRLLLEGTSPGARAAFERLVADLSIS